MFKIYFSSFDTKMQLCFDIYDFDHDGQISREDVWIILVYLPQVSTFLRNLEQWFESDEKIKKTMFENRIKTMEQIEELLNVIFTGREILNYENFAEITSSEVSDLLVNVSFITFRCWVSLEIVFLAQAHSGKNWSNSIRRKRKLSILLLEQYHLLFQIFICPVRIHQDTGMLRKLEPRQVLVEKQEWECLETTQRKSKLLILMKMLSWRLNQNQKLISILQSKRQLKDSDKSTRKIKREEKSSNLEVLNSQVSVRQLEDQIIQSYKAMRQQRSLKEKLNENDSSHQQSF